MVRFGVSSRRWTLLATLAVLLGVTWKPVQSLTTITAGNVLDRPARDATAWLSTLPSFLTPPVVPAGWQVVSMVADDIDADGDLDVVANDGSLDLVVWINDGTGRLSRQPGAAPSGLAQKMSGAAISGQPIGSPAAHLPSSVAHGDSSLGSVLFPETARPCRGSTETLMPPLVSVRSPRAPPQFLSA
jgi:hypothetical protein